MDPSLGMGTTGGALALVGAEPASSATIIEKVSAVVNTRTWEPKFVQLLESGAIILGKATLSACLP